MISLLICLFCTLIHTMEVAVHPAASVQERQASVSSVCLYYSDDSSVTCPNVPCQVATALSPAILFCSDLLPYTTQYDYTSGVTCGECCESTQPSAFKFECDNAATIAWGCGFVGNIQTGEVAEGLATVAGFTTSTSITEATQTSLVTASPSAAISGPRTTSASPTITSTVATPATTSTSATPAMKSTSASPAMASSSASPAQVSTATDAGKKSSGLSTGSEAGSVVGATIGAIAIAIAIIFGYGFFKRRRQHRRSQSQTQSEGLLEMDAVAYDKNDTKPSGSRAEARLSELPAENRPEELSDPHWPRAELS